MASKNYEDLYKPEFRDMVKEERLLSKLSQYITGAPINPALNNFLENLIKTHQIHFADTSRVEKDPTIEATKASFSMSTAYDLLKLQYAHNVQKIGENLSDDEVIRAADILFALLKLDPQTSIDTKRALIRWMDERNLQHSFIDDPSFKKSILINHFPKSSTPIPSAGEIERDLQSCMLYRVPVGVYLSLPPALAKKYFDFNEMAAGCAARVEHLKRDFSIIITPYKEVEGKRVVDRKVLEHEMYHVIYGEIKKNNSLSETRSKYKLERIFSEDFLRENGISWASIKLGLLRNTLVDLDGAIKNELFAQSKNIPVEISNIAAIQSSRGYKVNDENFHKFVKKIIVEGFCKHYVAESFWPIYNLDQMIGELKGGNEAAKTAKSKKLAEVERIGYKLVDLLIKYPSFANLISFTISVSEFQDLEESFIKLEAFLEKYSK